MYDRSRPHETFLGHVRWTASLDEKAGVTDQWLALEPRGAGEEPVTGEIRIHVRFQKTDKKHFGPENFQILKLIGKGKHRLSVGRRECLRPSLLLSP